MAATSQGGGTFGDARGNYSPRLERRRDRWAVMQAMSPALGIELSPIDVRDPDDFERGLTSFARQPNSGLVVVTFSLGRIHRKLLITLAERYRVPAVYPSRHFV